jgi:hypothetical protein
MVHSDGGHQFVLCPHVAAGARVALFIRNDPDAEGTKGLGFALCDDCAVPVGAVLVDAEWALKFPNIRDAS